MPLTLECQCEVRYRTSATLPTAANPCGHVRRSYTWYPATAAATGLLTSLFRHPSR